MQELVPYKESKRKLVLGIDVGTTYSGMSYVILEPGKTPQIASVNRYPGQENRPADCRIPSILYYGSDGLVQLVGAQAAATDVQQREDYDSLVLAKWFKLHLRPRHLNDIGPIPSLPPGKSVVNVFADFLRYMFNCARKYIQETRVHGESIWEELEGDIEFVLGHPNGWGGPQEQQMMEAAAEAGLVPATAEGFARIHFVTEGEAGLHFCLRDGLINDSLKANNVIMLLDAGGGTADLSTYVYRTAEPLSVEELCVPECTLSGSTFVNMEAETYIRKKLDGTNYGTDEIVNQIMLHFDEDVKPAFSNEPKRGYYLRTGLIGNDPRVNIKRGTLTLTREEMTLFFKPVLDRILGCIQAQFSNPKDRAPSSVFLIGGFSANEWLFNSLKNTLERMGVSISRPDQHASKAVADGALLYYLQHHVKYRKTKATVGVPVDIRFNPSDKEHRARIDSVDVGPIGMFLSKGFSPIVKKGRLARDGETFQKEYRVVYSRSKTLDEVEDEVLAYNGDKDEPQFTDDEPDKFKRLCLIRADVSKLPASPDLPLPLAAWASSKVYKVIITFGATMTAKIGWVENGEEQEGPARILWDSM